MSVNILITGASSGIGAALAEAYATPGRTLFLWGRDETRLASVAGICRSRGANVAAKAFDLTDFAALSAGLEAADETAPLDLAIFCAGLGGSLPQDRAGQEAKTAERMAGVNFTAPCIGANVIAERMAKRKSGHIVLVGSVAGVFPLPMAPLYSGSKAGLAMFAEALSLRLRRHGVAVTLVSPGFVDTPMSRSVTEAKPFMINADQAAATIARKLGRRPRHIIVPWQYAMIMKVSKLVPRFVLRMVLSAF